MHPLVDRCYTILSQSFYNNTLVYMVDVIEGWFDQSIFIRSLEKWQNENNQQPFSDQKYVCLFSCQWQRNRNPHLHMYSCSSSAAFEEIVYPSISFYSCSPFIILFQILHENMNISLKNGLLHFHYLWNVWKICAYYFHAIWLGMSRTKS